MKSFAWRSQLSGRFGPRVLVLVATGAVLFASACGDDDDNDEASPSSSAPPTTTGEAPSTSVDPNDPEALLQAALLTAADVGPDFTDVPYDEPNPELPGPCGLPSVGKLFPDALRLGADIEKGDALSLSESLSVFADAATAQAAYDAGVENLSCASPSLIGKPVEITPAQDVTADVGGEQALAWSVSGAGVQGVLVAVKSQEAVITFTFLSPGGSDTTGAPDPIALAKLGVEKIEDA